MFKNLSHFTLAAGEPALSKAWGKGFMFQNQMAWSVVSCWPVEGFLFCFPVLPSSVSALRYQLLFYSQKLRQEYISLLVICSSTGDFFFLPLWKSWILNPRLFRSFQRAMVLMIFSSEALLFFCSAQTYSAYGFYMTHLTSLSWTPN